MKGCFGQIILLVVGAVLGAIITLAVLFAVTVTPGSSQRVAPPPPVPGQPDLTITTSESFLNREMAAQLGNMSIPFFKAESIKLDVKPGAIIDATLGLRGPANTVVAVNIKTLVTRAGDRVKVDVTSVSSGPVSAPPELTKILQNQLNQQIQGAITRNVPVKIQILDVQSSETAMTFKVQVLQTIT